MLSTFYVLRALSIEWDAAYRTATIVEAYSQRRDELVLSLDVSGDVQTIRAQLGGSIRFVTAHPDAGRKRRNVADVLPGIVGRSVAGVRVADRDRILHIDLEGGWRLDIVIFGPRANAYLVDDGGTTQAAFRGGSVAERPPEPRRAPTVAELRAEGPAWLAARPDKGGIAGETTGALARSLPLMNAILASECVHRAGVSNNLADLSADERGRLLDVVERVEQDCHAPEPRIFWREDRPLALSLIRMQHLADARDERFETVSLASHVFVRRMLAWSRFDEEFKPASDSVDRELRRSVGRLERLRSELEVPSRADAYERWGHILMANPHAQIPRGEPGSTVALELPDPFVVEGSADTHLERIPVRGDLSVMQNAQILYEKARASRQAREAALARVETLTKEVDRLRSVYKELEAATDPESWRAAREAASADLEPFLSGRQQSEPTIPFRRYELGSGFELWVGRNAAQNDELTTRVSRKFDLWLHARGVGGSHAVLRPPNRTVEIPEETIQRAASIVAYYSKARGSALVPVIVAERKFVRKPRRAEPGMVIVDRHRVVMVEPGLPA